MSWVAAAVVGSAVVGGVVQSKAAKSAASAQVESSEAAVAEKRRQFDETRKLLEPYVTAGTEAMAGLEPYAAVGEQGLQGQLALAGLSGPEAQRAAIQAIEQGEEYRALTGAGEEAILQSAAATGGLRGGNVQGALAQFRPQVLSSLINQQYSRLGGFTALGQQTTQNLANMGANAAAGQATAGQQTAANIGNLYGQMGAAQAGSALAQGQAWGNVFGGIGQLAGAIGTGAIANPFAGGGSSLAPTSSLRPVARPF